MRDETIRKIIEVRKQERELEKRKAELETLMKHLMKEIDEISDQMWDLQMERGRLEYQFNKEHTREFLRLMDEDDIRDTILSNGSIKGFKF